MLAPVCTCVGVCVFTVSWSYKKKRSESCSSDSWSPCNAWWASSAPLLTPPLSHTLLYIQYNSYVPVHMCTCFTVWPKYMDTPAHLHLRTECSYILGNSILPTFLAKVWGRPFPVSACTTRGPCRNSFLSLVWTDIQHLWDELGPRLWARPYPPTCCPKILWKKSLKPEEWRLLQQHINAQWFWNKKFNHVTYGWTVVVTKKRYSSPKLNYAMFQPLRASSSKRLCEQKAG